MKNWGDKLKNLDVTRIGCMICLEQNLELAF